MTEPTHTFTEIREASNAFLANAGSQAFQNILNEFKADSIQDLKPDQYDRFLRVLELGQKEDNPPEPVLHVNIPEFQLKKQAAAKKKERRLYLIFTIFMIIVALLILVAIILLAMVVFRV